MITIRAVDVMEIYEDAQPLMREHWEEVAKETGVPEPKMNPDLLRTLQITGMLITVAAFDEKGDLAGYALNVLGPPIDFAQILVMQNEGLFMRKEHRGRASLRLIEESERIAKERGATRAMWHTYLDSRADALFSRLPGYKAYDRPYSKEL